MTDYDDDYDYADDDDDDDDDDYADDDDYDDDDDYADEECVNCLRMFTPGDGASGRSMMCLDCWEAGGF